MNKSYLFSSGIIEERLSENSSDQENQNKLHLKNLEKTHFKQPNPLDSSDK